MKRVELGDLDPKLGELLGEAERGEDVVFTRQGQPVARLVMFPRLHDPEAAQRALDDLFALGDELRSRGVTMTVDEIRKAREEGWG